MMGDRQDFLRALTDKLGQEYTADSVREILRVAEDVAAVTPIIADRSSRVSPFSCLLLLIRFPIVIVCRLPSLICGCCLRLHFKRILRKVNLHKDFFAFPY